MANKPALTGLEAIRFMEQGGTVFHKNESTLEVILNKIENDVLYWCQDYELEDNLWKVDDSFNFNLLYEEYIEPELTGWERVGNRDFYFRISEDCVVPTMELGDVDDDMLMEKANYFSTEEKAKEVDFEQTLHRKLRRFSDENGGSEIDYSRESCQHKWFIEYDKDEQLFLVSCCYDVRVFGTVYFSSKEVTYKAIEKFKDDLIKYFTTHD